MEQNNEILIEFENEKYSLDKFALNNLFNELYNDIKIKNVSELQYLTKQIQETIFRYEYISLLDGEDIVKMLRILLWIDSVFVSHAIKIEE